MSYLKRFLTFLVIAIVLSSCNEEPKSNFVLRGRISGLKKGVVYLQKDGDSSIITLDSMEIKGQPEFLLQTNIEEPKVLYLKLFKNDGEENYVPFFADKCEMYLTSSLDNFSFKAKITGSKQQEVLDEYLDMMANFNNANLDLIQETFLAQKDGDSIKADSLQIQSDRLFKRKYAYTINFALMHKDSEVAPYLAMYEIPNTNIRYIDSIYNNLEEPIKNSFYGLQLKAALEAAVTDQ